MKLRRSYQKVAYSFLTEEGVIVKLKLVEIRKKSSHEEGKAWNNYSRQNWPVMKECPISNFPISDTPVKTYKCSRCQRRLMPLYDMECSSCFLNVHRWFVFHFLFLLTNTCRETRYTRRYKQINEAQDLHNQVTVELRSKPNPQPLAYKKRSTTQTLLWSHWEKANSEFCLQSNLRLLEVRLYIRETRNTDFAHMNCKKDQRCTLWVKESVLRSRDAKKVVNDAWKK